MMARSVADARVEPLVVEAVAAELRGAAEHRDAVGALAEGLEHEVLADAPDAGGQHAHAVALAAPAAAVEALEGVVRRPLAREDHDPRRAHGRISGEGGGEGRADLAVAGQRGVRRADRADGEAAAAERARGRARPARAGCPTRAGASRSPPAGSSWRRSRSRGSARRRWPRR